MKIQTKTTILFTVLTGAIFLLLNITVYFFIRSYANNDFEKRLELRTKLYAKITFDPGDKTTEAFQQIQKQYLETLPKEEGYILRADTIGTKTDGPLFAEVPAGFLNSILDGGGETIFYENRFRHFAGILHREGNTNYLVIKSADNEYGSVLMRQLRILKLFSLLGSIALIFSIGTVFSKKTFKPIRDVINKVRQITEANLHLRLKERPGADELTELTGTFNQMLNRLETAFESQNNFISNASHELRTPLTAISGEADFALYKQRTVEEYQHSMRKIVQHAEKLKELTTGLLALAQTGFDGKKQIWETIRLDELLYNVKANCDAILPGNKVQVDIAVMPDEEENTSVRGNPDLLKIALSNIVMNACKYSGNQLVKLQLLFRERTVVITVRDSGIGIPADELKNIYDPFFRASNAKSYDGFGIGMPLSRNIIRLHKGSIHVSSAVNRGTVVEIHLPLD